MSINKIKGIYLHTKSKKFYNVIGVGRSVENVDKPVVVYKQMYESKLRGTNILLPKGSIWTRDYDDFNGAIDENGTPKFIKVKVHKKFEK